ncbi:hypothetical protein GCM10010254_39610 [Streptomyces chromofuscus]|nr:hypothetical protein GCM10010254_39610 [Streptomyces chromofuscus]
MYGTPDVDLVTEATPCVPMSPYGETKLAGEWLVRATGRATGLATASLRYFNVAGAASPELADLGVFNLVPMVFDGRALRAVELGELGRRLSVEGFAGASVRSARPGL